MRIFESKLNNLTVLALMDENLEIHAVEMSGIVWKRENFSSYDLKRIKEGIFKEKLGTQESEAERIEFAARLTLDLLRMGLSSSAAVKKALREAGLSKKHDKLVRNSEAYRPVKEEYLKSQCKKIYK